MHSASSLWFSLILCDGICFFAAVYVSDYKLLNFVFLLLLLKYAICVSNCYWLWYRLFALCSEPTSVSTGAYATLLPAVCFHGNRRCSRSTRAQTGAFVIFKLHFDSVNPLCFWINLEDIFYQHWKKVTVYRLVRLIGRWYVCFWNRVVFLYFSCF